MADREQIEKMAQVMCGFCAVDKRCVLKCCAPCSDIASQDCTCKESAEELICKGYGKVSEYKAEIERLKSEIIKQDQAIIERNFELVELEDKIKQAQIDVLNKLKERLYSIFVTKSSPLGDITVEDIAEDIDELIKEIEEHDDRRH